MSTTELSIRLRGELPSSEDLTNLLGILPSFTRRKGEPILKGKGIQPVDVWGRTLIERDLWTDARPNAEALAQAVSELGGLAPLLSNMSRSRCSVELYLSHISDSEQGGFELPNEVITAAGLAKLDLVVSILCDAEDNDTGDSHEDTGDGNGSATA